METTQEFIKRFRRQLNTFLNKIVREEGYPRGYKQMLEESPINDENAN